MILPRAVIVPNPAFAGNFGVVRKALWNNRQKRSVVAVKQLESTLAIDRAGFLEEAALAAQFNHKNVSRLLGVATVDDPMLLVIELCTGTLFHGHAPPPLSLSVCVAS